MCTQRPSCAKRVTLMIGRSNPNSRCATTGFLFQSSKRAQASGEKSLSRSHLDELIALYRHSKRIAIRRAGEGVRRSVGARIPVGTCEDFQWPNLSFSLQSSAYLCGLCLEMPLPQRTQTRRGPQRKLLSFGHDQDFFVFRRYFYPVLPFLVNS